MWGLRIMLDVMSFTFYIEHRQNVSTVFLWCRQIIVVFESYIQLDQSIYGLMVITKNILFFQPLMAGNANIIMKRKSIEKSKETFSNMVGTFNAFKVLVSLSDFQDLFFELILTM